MSGLILKADIHRRYDDVRFVPMSDIARSGANERGINSGALF
jgi:hypothetical protein